VGSVLRRDPRTIAWAALTVVFALALPIAVMVGLEHRVPVRGIGIAAAILFVALLVVSTFALITRRRAPEGARRSLESDSSDAQPSSRQRS
jgi:heme A synthase